MWSEMKGFNMSDGDEKPDVSQGSATDEGQNLPPAAKRALEEAEARRAARNATQAKSTELNGPKGEEPTRYGDWERNGRAVDF